MTIDVKALLADGEAFYRNAADIDGAPLPVVEASTDIVPDTTSNPGYISWALGANPTVDALTLGAHGTITSARMATQVALPSCTYSNGASGVGATLTASANGVLADIDFITPVASDRILVKNQASAFQNGIYTVTTLGTAGTPFVLTRVPEADDAATYVDGIAVVISTGVTYRGAVFSAVGTITMGTTNIVWQGVRSNPTPTDLVMGASRDRARYFSDFEDMSVALAPSASVQMIVGATGFVGTVPAAATAAAITQEHGASGETSSRGVLGIATGTTTTGAPSVVAGRSGFAFDSTKPLRCGAKLRTPTLTDGTNTFLVRFGFSDNWAGGTPTEGIFFEAIGDAGEWDCVCVAASSESRAATSPTRAAGTTYNNFAIHYDERTGYAYFYASISGVMTQVGAINTNIPTGTLSGGVIIDKSAGTTSRSLNVDYLAFDAQDARTPLGMLP